MKSDCSVTHLPRDHPFPKTRPPSTEYLATEPVKDTETGSPWAHTTNPLTHAKWASSTTIHLPNVYFLRTAAAEIFQKFVPVFISVTMGRRHEFVDGRLGRGRPTESRLNDWIPTSVAEGSTHSSPCSFLCKITQESPRPIADIVFLLFGSQQGRLADRRNHS